MYQLNILLYVTDGNLKKILFFSGIPVGKSCFSDNYESERSVSEDIVELQDIKMSPIPPIRNRQTMPRYVMSVDNSSAAARGGQKLKMNLQVGISKCLKHPEDVFRL